MRTFEFEDVRNHCSAKMAVSESFPFDQHTMVWKVAGRIFAIADIDAFTGVSLKCDPERAVALREEFVGVRPGWHLNKTHWNSVDADQDVPWERVKRLIDHSYDLVIAGLPKKSRIPFGL